MAIIGGIDQYDAYMGDRLRYCSSTAQGLRVSSGAEVERPVERRGRLPNRC